jgi:hypothetical protein
MPWMGAAGKTGDGVQIRPAPRSRRLLAKSIDAAVPLLLIRRGIRRSATEHGASGDPSLSMQVGLVQPALTFVREQLASPGEWIAGVRTVDARTGRRLDAWRTLVALAAQAGVVILQRRLRPTLPSVDHDARIRELGDLRQRHAGDADALNAAMMEHYQTHQVTVSLWPWLPVSLVAGLVAGQLRRRLAPTVVVRRAARTAEPDQP